MTDDELDSAALRNLPQSVKTGSSATSFELGFGDTAKMNAQRDAIQKYRQRVARIVDKEIRRAYEKWLDFFQRENNEAREEAETGARRAAWLRHKAQRQADEARIRQCQEKIQKP